MSLAEAKRPYTSRCTPKAVREPVITARDIELFKLLTRYAYLQSDYIRALIGGEVTSLRERLKQLTAAGYLDRPKQQRQHYNANYRPLVYSLGKRGANALAMRGIEGARPPVHRNFAHELMTCELMASLELGARETGARLITWQDIVANEALPEKTRRSQTPFRIPITVRVEGQRKDVHIQADGEPFGIERVVDGRRGYFFCPGIEADCATEPVDVYDLARSSIVKKYKLYEAIYAERVHQSHFGFPNFFVPIITTNKVRMRTMMDALMRVTGGKGSKIFLFKTYPAFTSFEPPLPPSGHVLTEPWARAGYPDFEFLK
jgi:hypothetical protein